MLRRAVAPVLFAGAIAACAGSGTGRGNETGKEVALPAKTIDQVLAGHTDSLMAIPGVVGTAIGLCEGERCITVFVNPDAAAKARIPDRLEGYRVRVEVTGPFRAR